MYKYLRVTISHDNQQAVTNKLFERDKRLKVLNRKFVFHSHQGHVCVLVHAYVIRRAIELTFARSAGHKKKAGNAPVFWLKAQASTS